MVVKEGASFLAEWPWERLHHFKVGDSFLQTKNKCGSLERVLTLSNNLTVVARPMLLWYFINFFEQCVWFRVSQCCSLEAGYGGQARGQFLGEYMAMGTAAP